MADEEEKQDEAGAEEGDEAPKKKSKLPLILAVVVLLGGGGGGAAWYLGVFGGAAEDGEAEAAAFDPATGMADPSVPGATLEIEPFIANLADQDANRYLKTTFQVEFETDVVPPEAQVRMPQIRDLLLTLLTSKTYGEIRTPAGKQNLREDIINRVNQVIDGDMARAVYFTEFIVQ